MAKYRITEEQLSKLFESMEMKRINELYDEEPEEILSTGKSARGNFKLIAKTSSEFLIMNGDTNELLYTLDLQWQDVFASKPTDIYDELSDFLDIPQQREYGDDGLEYVYADDWKDMMDSDDIAGALVQYLNYHTAKGSKIEITDNEDEWLTGEFKFLKITPETVEYIEDRGLEEKAAEIIGFK